MANKFIPKNKLFLDEDRVISLYKEGMSIESIARHFGSSTTPVVRILRENKIPSRPMGFQVGDQHWNWKSGRFFVKHHGYYKRSINGRKFSEHHYIWIRENKMPIPKGCVIHHKNMDKTDNRIENLVLLPKDVHDNLHWYLRKNGERLLQTPI